MTRTLLVVVARLVVLGTALAGCGFQGGAGARPPGHRLVTGQLVLPDEDLLGRQVTGLQIAGLAIDASGGVGDETVEAYTSAILDPSQQLSTLSFAVPVLGTKSFVLVLQVPSASGRAPGALLAAASVDDGLGGTDLVPQGLADLELGVVSVDVEGGGSGARALVIADAHNPLAQVDTDDDGQTDNIDTDDDEDGTADADDADRSGDGIDDVHQTLGALPDDDHDGVADLLE